MKIILTKSGKEIMVDDSDYAFLSCLKWHAQKDGRTFYAGNHAFGRMHAFLIPHDKPMEVDHIDGNGLNNQRSNLRVCTHQQNNWNIPKKSINSSSKYKGVSFIKDVFRNKPWNAKIREGKKMKSLGVYSSEVEAAKAYDRAALLYHGEYASLNFKEAM